MQRAKGGAQKAAQSDGPPDPVLQFLRTVWQLEHALERASKRMEDTLGISGPQRFALRIIGVRPGITAGDLAGVLHLHPSTVTGILQRLQARGLVKRTASATDGRLVHLNLTAAGKRANKPSVRGTIEHAVRATLSRCPAPARRSAASVMDRFAEELMKL
ncbi:MAG: MarR family winged helix-turn-helix transcriptional regulator [Vicinamibacterales bacterium]